MNKSLTIGGALLALAAITTTAEARMLGGTSMPSSHMSRGDIHSPVTSSLGSPRTFSPDGHTSGVIGRTFSPDGLQSRVKGSNWKHPIDSDGGGPADPPKKPPKGGTQTGSKDSSQGGGWTHDPPWHHDGHGGWTDKYGHYHAPGSGGGANSSDPPPASRTPR